MHRAFCYVLNVNHKGLDMIAVRKDKMLFFGKIMFQLWLMFKPKIIKQTAKALNPWTAYRVKETGQHGYVRSYFEDGTVSLLLFAHDDEIRSMMIQMAPYGVFGYGPNDLEQL